VVIDVTPLELGRHFRVSDLSMPEKVTVLTEPDIVVAHVVARREEEVAPAAAEVAAEGEAAASAEPEVIKKGKTAEGEAQTEAKPEKPEKAEKKEKK